MSRGKKQIPSMEDLGIRRKVPVFLGEGDERIQIGEADVQQAVNGGLIVDMYLAGMWTDPAIMSECLQMKGFISEGQRKD